MRVALNPRHEVRMTADGDCASSRLRVSLFCSSSPADVSMIRESEAVAPLAPGEILVSKPAARLNSASSWARRFLPTIAKLFFAIVVETPARFSAEITCLDHPVLDRAGPKSRILEEGLIERVRGCEVHIVADQVHKFERPHGESSGVLHDSVDGFDRDIAIAKDAQGLVVKGAGDPIDDESGCVLRTHRRLSHPADDGCGLLHRRRARPVSLDDFHERHERRRIKKMHAEHALGLFGCPGDGSDRKGRGVRREQGLRAADSVQLFEELPLQLKLFRGSLNNQLASREIFQSQGRGEPGYDIPFLFGGELSPLLAPLKETADPAEPLVDELLRDIVDQSLESRLRGDLRNSRAHSADAKNSDLSVRLDH